jgi:hypothetical protein
MIIGRYRLDYKTAVNLDMKRKTEISLEEAMNLEGRGIIIDKEQDIYTNDLHQEERRSSLLTIFECLKEQI